MKNQWKYCFYFFRIYTKITHRDLLFNGQQIFNKKNIIRFQWFFNMLSILSYIEYWNTVKKIYLVVVVY